MNNRFTSWPMSRRQFAKASLSAAAGCAAQMGELAGATAAASRPVKEPTFDRLPRWRGFNLLEKFTWREGGNPPFHESDFAAMAELGFDFVRLPMSYLCWADLQDWW